MPISSLIVRTRPECAQHVATRVIEFEGASAPERREDCIVVLTETADRDADKELWGAIQAIDGVMGVDLIYHDFEDLDGAEQ